MKVKERDGRSSALSSGELEGRARSYFLRSKGLGRTLSSALGPANAQPLGQLSTRRCATPPFPPYEAPFHTLCQPAPALKSKPSRRDLFALARFATCSRTGKASQSFAAASLKNFARVALMHHTTERKRKRERFRKISESPQSGRARSRAARVLL